MATQAGLSIEAEAKYAGQLGELDPEKGKAPVIPANQIGCVDPKHMFACLDRLPSSIILSIDDGRRVQLSHGTLDPVLLLHPPIASELSENDRGMLNMDIRTQYHSLFAKFIGTREGVFFPPTDGSVYALHPLKWMRMHEAPEKNVSLVDDQVSISVRLVDMYLRAFDIQCMVACQQHKVNMGRIDAAGRLAAQKETTASYRWSGGSTWGYDYSILLVAEDQSASVDVSSATALLTSTSLYGTTPAVGVAVEGEDAVTAAETKAEEDKMGKTHHCYLLMSAST